MVYVCVNYGVCHRLYIKLYTNFSWIHQLFSNICNTFEREGCKFCMWWNADDDFFFVAQGINNELCSDLLAHGGADARVLILNGTLFIRYKIDDDDNNDTDFDTDDSTNTPRSDCCHDGSGRLWSFKNRRTRTRRTRTAALSSTATLNDNYLLHPHYQYQYLLFIGNYSWKNQVSSENCSNINCRYREHHELILNLVKHTLNWIRQQPLSAVPTLCNQYSHSVHYL